MFGSEVWNLKISFVAIMNRTLLTQQATRERTSRRKILRIESKTEDWEGEKKKKNFHCLMLVRDMNQGKLEVVKQTGSKSGKAYVKAVCCHPPYLTYMWTAS